MDSISPMQVRTLLSLPFQKSKQYYFYSSNMELTPMSVPMTYSQAKEAIISCIQAKLVPFLRGSPGV